MQLIRGHWESKTRSNSLSRSRITFIGAWPEHRMNFFTSEENEFYLQSLTMTVTFFCNRNSHWNIGCKYFHDWFLLWKHGCEKFLRWQEICPKCNRINVNYKIYDIVNFFTSVNKTPNFFRANPEPSPLFILYNCAIYTDVNFSSQVCRVGNFPALHQHSMLKRAAYTSVFPSKRKSKLGDLPLGNIIQGSKFLRIFLKFVRVRVRLFLWNRVKTMHPNTREKFLKNLVLFMCEISNG